MTQYNIELVLGKFEGENRKDKQEWEQDQTYKGMTPPSIQNLKALGLWVFFLICCSTFSFLSNVGLRLTLGYLTISPSSESLSPSSRSIGEITQEWELSQHIREWHHLQPKTLRHWVCGSSLLYVAQLSHSCGT